MSPRLFVARRAFRFLFAAEYLRAHGAEAEVTREKERVRRERKAKRGEEREEEEDEAVGEGGDEDSIPA